MKEVKALIADDSKVMRMMVMNNLREAELASFEFVQAEDGQEAFEKYEEEEDIDILFLDWNMPKMTGIEIVRKVRELDEDIPIVMVTSEKAMGKMMEAIDEAGADAYVCKPFTPGEFERKVGDLIERIEEYE